MTNKNVKAYVINEQENEMLSELVVNEIQKRHKPVSKSQILRELIKKEFGKIKK